MIGLFGTLDIGARSLDVQQQEMEIASNNLANVNNASYASEQLVVSTATPEDTPIGDEGTGVNATGITESRNAMLDSQIQAEDSVTGSLNAQLSGLENAEAYLDEQISTSSSSTTADSPNGLTADLSNMFDAFQSLSTDPSNVSLRQTAIQSAQAVAQQFNQVSSQLSGVNADFNTSIQNDTASANQYLSNIAQLNGQIVQAQEAGGSADQLIDQREQDLESLGNLVNFSASAQANGAVNVSIGGVAMVSGANAVDGLAAQDPGNGQLQVVDQNSGQVLTLTGGSLEGEMTARDGALTDLTTSLNTVASQLISQTNAIYSTGYDLNGNTGQDLFTGNGASDIAVNSALLADPSQFQASGAAGADGDNTTVLALAQLANQNISALGNQTIGGYYDQSVANLGTAISTVNDNLATSSDVSQSLTAERNSESGVSLDDQMASLIQYQKAYEASAELVTTLDQMLQTVVSMKTT